jgi:gliding motility-associated-like protein
MSSSLGATSTVSGLGSGGYFVSILDANGNPAGCFRDWIFINETTVEAGPQINGCGPFTLSGTSNPVANFTYYNPPANPLLVDATTTITVCFNATHTYVSDLGFFLVGPNGGTVALSPNPGAYNHPSGSVCNGGDNVNNLCFTTNAAGNFDPCSAPAPYTGTYSSYGPAGSGNNINWSTIYGEDMSEGGWSVQIYDCISADVGSLTGATITFNGVSSCGPVNVNYASGAINSPINDNSCTPATASIFTVPQNPSVTTPIVLNNTITNVAWSTGDNTATSNVNPAPLNDTWYYFTATDNFGCTATDSVLFVNTCVCIINNMTANISAADCSVGTFGITGIVEFTNQPTTGTLTVSNCSGDSQVFNAPFTSPINYSIQNIPADGTTNCEVTAVFSADPNCEQTIGPFTEPICNCFFSLIDITIGACNPADDTFEINGTVEFQSAPATGTLIVEDCNGNFVSFPAPFISPQNFTIAGIPADGTPNCNITAYFSADPTCDIVSSNYNNPADCQCSAAIGSFTTTASGDGQTNYVLCFGDQIDINSNLDYTAPADENLAGVTYDPGLAYIIYSCPPTVFPPNALVVNNAWADPCIVGIASFGDNIDDNNTLGGPPYVGTYNNNIVYYVPITMYSIVDGIYAISLNGGDNCYAMGPPIAVQYLPAITFTQTTNCNAGTATFTLLGGLPQINGSNFTVSNLTPVTASFNNTTATHNGTVVISGLQNGDMYSFDVIDANGCPITISSGPFVATPVADAGTDATQCSLTYTLAANPSYGTGTWTGGPGVVFSNANSPTSSVTVPAAGSYTFTWTETTGVGCTSTDQVVVQFSNVQFNQTVVNSTCGNADGSITLTANSGITPYTFSIDNGATTQATGVFSGLGSGTYNIIVEDAIQCTATGTINVQDLGGPTLDGINGNNLTCNAVCNGSISINATGATQFSINNGVNFQALNTFTNLCAGVYNIVVADNLNCEVSGTITITEPTALTHTTTPVNLVCNNQCNGQITINASGGTTNYQYSIDNGATTSLSNVFSNLCSGTYNILVTDANSCTSTSQVVLSQPNPLSVTIGITDATCFGQCNGMMNSIPAGGTGAGTYSYSWSPAVGGNVPLVTNLCAGTYNLTITDGNGCVLDTNGILVGAPVAVTIDNVTIVNELCGGDCNGSLTINSSGGTSYSLDGITYGASNVFSNLCAGNYTVYTQDANGCSASEPVVITGPTPVQVQASGSSTICIGGTANLTSVASGGVGGYTYAWDNGGITQNINVSPTNSQTYCVVVTDANGCNSPNSCVTIDLHPALNLIALSDQSLCAGESTQITAVGGGGNGGPYTYTWNQGVGVGQTQTVSPAFTTTYTVTLSDNCETPDITADVTITVNTIPNISFSADNFDGCAPVAASFTQSNVPAGSQCFWSFGDGGASTDCNIVNYSFENPGCWDVTLNIITPEGCQSSSTIPNYICVYDYPNPSFEFGPQPTTVLNPTINFQNQTSGVNSYNWIFDTNGAAATNNATNPSYTFPDAGFYEVCLEAISAQGCPGVTCDIVEIKEEFIIYVPNAFTPDGDGLNDLITPVISGIEPNSYEFLVFNRWGELIFQSQIVGQGWDGTYKSVMSQQDVYVWKVKVKDQLGKVHDFIGHVTLIK